MKVIRNSMIGFSILLLCIFSLAFFVVTVHNVTSGILSFNDIDEEAEEENHRIKPLVSNAILASREVKDNLPKGYTVQHKGIPSPPSTWMCRDQQWLIPPSDGFSAEDSAGNVVSFVMFPPGTATRSLEHFSENLTSCAGRGVSVYQTRTDQGSLLLHVRHGQQVRYVDMRVIGDAIVTSETGNKAENPLNTVVSDVLQRHKCEDLQPSSIDEKRNPYVLGRDLSQYSGWERTKTENLQSSILGRVWFAAHSQPVTIAAVSLKDYSETTRNLPLVEPTDPVEQPPRPFDPMPSFAPLVLPEIPTKPSGSLTPFAPLPDFEVVIKDTVDDPQGPGCGWEFHKFHPPLFDAAEQHEISAENFQEQQQEIVLNYVSSINQRFPLYAKRASLYVELSEYDSAVKQFNDQAEIWLYVNEARANYLREVDLYNESVTRWNEFIQEWYAARDELRQQEKLCAIIGPPAPTMSPPTATPEPTPPVTATPEPTQTAPPTTPQCPPPPPPIFSQEPPSVLPSPQLDDRIQLPEGTTVVFEDIIDPSTLDESAS